VERWCLITVQVDGSLPALPAGLHFSRTEVIGPLRAVALVHLENPLELELLETVTDVNVLGDLHEREINLRSPARQALASLGFKITPGSRLRDIVEDLFSARGLKIGL